MKIVYEGRRDALGRTHVTVFRWGTATRPLDPRFDLCDHSPDGFEWGYGGSGPAQLALAMLADFTGDKRQAIELHEDFKRAFIAPLQQNQPWTISGAAIERWLKRKAKR